MVKVSSIIKFLWYAGMTVCMVVSTTLLVEVHSTVPDVYAASYAARDTYRAMNKLMLGDRDGDYSGLSPDDAVLPSIRSLEQQLATITEELKELKRMEVAKRDLNEFEFTVKAVPKSSVRAITQLPDMR